LSSLLKQKNLIPDCGQPHDIDFGKMIPQNKTTFQSSANVICDDGYYPTTENIQCEATGNWSFAKCKITGNFLYYIKVDHH
jgi:hypothetical protein